MKLEINKEAIVSKTQFLNFIDVILAHDFVEQYEDEEGILDFLNSNRDYKEGWKRSLSNMPIEDVKWLKKAIGERLEDAKGGQRE